MVEILTAVTAVEWVGYAASVGVLVSFLMKDINMLRKVNSVGCALFVLYGVMLPIKIGLPIIITNVVILIINLYSLLKKAK
jgi:hypothetical protein